MSWVKLDDKFWSHPDVLHIGNEAAGVFCRMLSYCGDQLTDGRIPPGIHRFISETEQPAGLLTEVGLVAPDGEGLVIPDFLKFNPSRKEVEKRRVSDRNRKRIQTDSDRNPERFRKEAGSGTGKSKNTTSKTSTESKDEAETIRSLADYWRDRCNHPNAKVHSGDERWTKVRARLRDGYSPEQIRQAIDGAAKAPHVSDSGKRFDDLELICRTKAKLEDFMERAKPSPTQPRRRKVDMPTRIGELIAKGVDERSAQQQAAYEAEKAA